MKSKAIFTFFLCCLSPVLWSNQKLDSLLNETKYLKTHDEFEQRALDFQQALILSEREGDLMEQAQVHNHLNHIFFKLNRYSEGIRESEYSLELYKRMEMWEKVSGTYYNLGLNYKKIGSIELAMRNLLLALKISEKLQNKVTIAKVCSVLGNINKDKSEYKKALAYHSAALAAYIEVGDSSAVSSCYHNIGQVYNKSGNLIQARTYLFKARSIKIMCGLSTAANSSQIGAYYYETNELDSAKFYFYKSIEERKREQKITKTVSPHTYLAELYFNENEFQLSKIHLDTAYQLADSAKLNQELITVLNLQMRLEKTEYPESDIIKKHERLTELNRIVVGEASLKETARLEVEYGSIKKSQEIERKNNEIALQDFENEKLNIRNNFFFAGLLIAAIFVIVIIIFNIKLRRRKEETELKNELLESKNALIDNLHKELSHRTKNYYQMFGGILKFDRRRTADSEIKKMLTSYINRVEAMSQIQRYLLAENTLTQEVQLDLYLSDLLSNIDLVLNNILPKVIITKSFETISCDYDKAIRIGLALNEMIANAFEHGFDQVENPKINVLLIESDNGLILIEIQDNGIGIKTQGEDRRESSKGIDLIEMILSSIGGELQYVEEDSKGTFVQIKISK
ncbi:MAG: tetratricopeptide repeat protein [Crocinitomix sp.]|nr:tetratricopeptide repeat protein [Crocinitomix sp.]